MLKYSFYTILLAGILSLAFIPSRFSNGGAIRGHVKDKATQEAIPFANVALYKDSLQVSTATTNADGEFAFKSLSPGSYKIKAVYVGYSPKLVSHISVTTNKTTWLTVSLVNGEGTKLNEVEVITYNVPMVDPDTKSSSTVTREEYQSLPTKDMNSVASYNANVYQNNQDKSLNMRGGRGKYVESKKQPAPSGAVYNYVNPTTDVVANEEYNTIKDNTFINAKKDPLSTFSIDVDKASYSNIRRFITGGSLPPADAVRVEELINYFSYTYPQPKKDQPFSISTQYVECPWNTAHQLIHVGIQGKEINTEKMPDNNLVFLLDVSGSMNDANKLPLLKSGLRLLVNQLREQDLVSIVVYAGAAGIALSPTHGNNKEKINEAIENLSAGGSTAGGEGILLAYKLAKQNFLSKGNNRVILATDGDFNVGVSSDADLIKLIEKQKEEGVFLTVLGFGTGNYKDSKMEQLADKGNGNYAYIDNILEAKKVLVKEMGGTLLTIAKDVKIQVEFNPGKVKAYRLVGYENRLLANEDFNDDKKDAGELGSGHTVTAIYEVIPAGSSEAVASVDSLKYQHSTLATTGGSNEIMTIKFRYKEPTGSVSKLITEVVADKKVSFSAASEDCRFAATVAEFGMLLRNSEFKGNVTFKSVLASARAAKGKDDEGYRAEFIKLVEMAELLQSNTTVSVPTQE